ncbi:C45 family autoproteolytic acyltransferase/hydolase [Halovivax sp.]|uniref:C45 family autoproteolytic acyltransferase/hydolase n=1 Tax=Halovivax sp. TaxID=1935978 RepID=UPI0025BE616E|nr:C45 family peptidase [Halovivax sp.]
MDDTDVETTAAFGSIAEPDTFAEQARRRAAIERDAVEWAIDELDALVDERDVDLDPLLAYARRSRESLPDRHRRAYEAMADEFAVDSDLYETYVFAFSELCEGLAEGEGRSEKHPAGPPESGSAPYGEGCTNVLVSPPAVDPSAAAEGPLVLKNRDIAGRGVRPKSVVEQPPIDDYYGFLTVDTCGTISIFKGVNDRGLVAANTHIECEAADVEPEHRLRNGTVIRMILEECATVAEARTLLESRPTRHLSGQTLFLADADDATLLEVDPAAGRIRVDDDAVVARTNHFVRGESTETESSRTRRERAHSLLEGDGGPADDAGLDRDDLWSLARDHEHGPGDDSICRHPEPDAGEHAFGQLTTASAAVFEGGTTEVALAMGNPCDSTRTRCALGGDVPTDLRTGRRWLDPRD